MAEGGFKSSGLVEIVIDSQGHVSFKVIGVKGAKCLALTKELEEALGSVISREYTSEYYEATTIGETIRLKKEKERRPNIQRV